MTICNAKLIGFWVKKIFFSVSEIFFCCDFLIDSFNFKFIFRARQLQGDNEPEKREPQELIRNDESKITFSLGGKKPLIETKATFSALCTPTNVLNAKSSSNLKEKTMQPSTSSSTSSNVQTNLRDNKGFLLIWFLELF